MPPSTLGIEEELHVVDLETGRLVSRAAHVLRDLPAEGFGPELQRTTVETNTAVCTTLSQLRNEILQLRTLVNTVASRHGAGIMATGSAPLSQAEDFELTVSGRFSRMQHEYQRLVDDQLICGLQVHVGVADRDLAVRVCRRVQRDLPTLLAMSSSSPFWHGSDTGYASYRTMIWQRWPTSGSFGPVDDAAGYDRLLEDLIGSKVISDAKMAYFDVRPSAIVPTVELRVCDACPVADDAVLIAALLRALVAEAEAAEQEGAPIQSRPDPIARSAMWRAARNGLAGPLLTPDDRPVESPATDVVQALNARLRPFLEDAGDQDDVTVLTENLLARGDSSRRQRQLFAEYGEMSAVVSKMVSDTRGTTTPAIVRPPLTKDYPPSPDDEAVAQSGVPFRYYGPLIEAVDAIGVEELHARRTVAEDVAREKGLTFGVGGVQQPIAVDVIPRLIRAHEWSVLAAGLTQRARALELFIRDIYGPARIVSDGVLDWGVIRRCPGWRLEARDLPAEVMRAPIVGFDLVRDVLGWRVLEDNARVPSGTGYATGVRRAMRAALPELAEAPIRDPDDSLSDIGANLRACTDVEDPMVALLSDGADNTAWYEHRLLAASSQMLLVQPAEVSVQDGAVYAGGRPVDVLYLRIGVELSDLRYEGVPIGQQILKVACDGGVVLANAPGNGIADDKAMYSYVGDLIRYYLGERALLQPVPTYLPSRPEELTLVLDRLESLVTKPVDGYGGSGVLIGPQATPAQLEERRRELIARPASFVAQDVVALSTHPTLTPDGLAPRNVDLRAFVLQQGTGPGAAHLSDIALTRVAAEGTMVVNSSQGGGLKDTWVLTSTLDLDTVR